MHYARHRRLGSPGAADRLSLVGGSQGECRVDGCHKNAHALGLCQMHRRRLRLNGEVGEAVPLRIMTNGRNPQSTSNTNRDGYTIVKVPGHPESKATGWALEHRVVMSDHLGRPLLDHESVHHLNGVRSDNRLENLELWSKSQPWGQRVTDKVAWAREILDLYGDHQPSLTRSCG